VTTPRRAEERGSGTVLGSAVIAVLVTATVLVAVLCGVLVQQRRLESAADLAALAGATALQQGKDGCRAALVAAHRNGGSLVACVTEGETVTVTAGQDTPLLFGWPVQRARARAGPSSVPPS
jgi:secretion/DNA translocation related TadE-like protein